MEIVGRHHDPFTMMGQFERPLGASLYPQPVTDIAGALLARVSGPVAAYNWLVLVTFPLAAAAAYLLGRYLALTPRGAAVAAIAYAFAPFHLAQAAYHPHIAQTQWIPIYLLALWRCLDRATVGAVGFLAAATLAVTLSNLYGGLIAAAITPVAIAAHWLTITRFRPGASRHAGITAATLVLLAGAGLAFAWRAAGAAGVNPAALAFPRADLFRYSAKWWSYLVPPVAHPIVGDAAWRIWAAAGVREGLLEQQVSLGWSIVALGLVAIGGWALARGRGAARSPVPVLMAVAAAALVCSLSPERTIGGMTVVRPSALLYAVAPMFRAYARFGVVVQLMAAMLAGLGVDALCRHGTARARLACISLVVLAAGEYAVSPRALSRDVLPTKAHRWVMQQTEDLRVLDCAPLDQESASVPWLTGSRVALLDGRAGDCSEPNLPATLAAEGYTHLLVRRGNREGRAFFEGSLPIGLCLAARFRDAQVFAVTAPVPRIYVAAMTGFWPREHDANATWRWMETDAAWTVVNTGTLPVAATLDVELAAFQHPRRMRLEFDGRAIQTLVIDPPRRFYQTGPFTVRPGRHELLFRAADAPTSARDAGDGRDPRRLSFALGTWGWTARPERP
jgi:hypothetical protein